MRKAVKLLALFIGICTLFIGGYVFQCYLQNESPVKPIDWNLPPKELHGFPMVIHQSWKTRTLPENFAKWSKNTLKLHPEWKYMLWTDEDNRRMIEQRYPWFLETWNSYDHFIKRVDACRYFYMWEHGGVYMDLDFEALKPLDGILESTDSDVVLGEMGDGTCEHCVPNAILISKKGDPFWMHVIQELMKRGNKGTPEEDTGPVMLKKCVETYQGPSKIQLLPSKYLYPLDWRTKTNSVGPDSYAITYWSHSW